MHANLMEASSSPKRQGNLNQSNDQRSMNQDELIQYERKNELNNTTQTYNSIEDISSPMMPSQIEQRENLRGKSAKRRKKDKPNNRKIVGLGANGSGTQKKDAYQRNEGIQSPQRIYQIYNASNLSNMSDRLKYRLGDKISSSIHSSKHRNSKMHGTSFLNQSVQLDKSHIDKSTTIRGSPHHHPNQNPKTLTKKKTTPSHQQEQ